MSRAASTISVVAAPRKGYDAERTLRYPSRLKEDLALLAEYNHRGWNDEAVIAIEERIARHLPEIALMRERRKPPRGKR